MDEVGDGGVDTKDGLLGISYERLDFDIFDEMT